MFIEICIYEAKLTKLDEIETLMKEVAEFYLSQDGVIDVHYIKRTHRQKNFNAVIEGELPARLTRNVGKVTYVLYWVLKDEETHARVSKLEVEKFYKRWNRCLTFRGYPDIDGFSFLSSAHLRPLASVYMEV